MSGRSLVGYALGAAAMVTASTLAITQSPFNQQDADSLTRKVLSILQYAEAPIGGSRLTPIKEQELNAFLRLGAAHRLPAGVTEPYVTMIGDGRVAASATVDLDAVRRAAPEGDWTDVRQWLSGRLPVEVRGLLRVQNGWARFELESAAVSGFTVPKILLQQILAHYSRSPEFPSGVDLDAPLELPARIREIHVNAQQAVIVQR
jgi:hypothetical protein